MPLVAIAVGSGLGNQLFMLAATLGYAERYGYTPVFWEEPKSSWEHKGSVFRIREMVPWMRVLTEEERSSEAGEWVILKEPPELVFSYTPLPFAGGRNVKLEGYFQSDYHGPSTFPTLPPALRNSSLRPELIAQPWHRTFFLHVRRGDYLDAGNEHHAVDLRGYWRRCLREMPADAVCFVVSDDMAWCRRELEEIVGDAWVACSGLGSGRKWLWCPRDLSDVETFFWMTACGLGGICANSTFSWWASWYVKRRVGEGAKIFMPKVWGYSPLPPVRHLHPTWALVC